MWSSQSFLKSPCDMSISSYTTAIDLLQYWGLLHRNYSFSYMLIQEQCVRLKGAHLASNIIYLKACSIVIVRIPEQHNYLSWRNITICILTTTAANKISLQLVFISSDPVADKKGKLRAQWGRHWIVSCSYTCTEFSVTGTGVK